MLLVPPAPLLPALRRAGRRFGLEAERGLLRGGTGGSCSPALPRRQEGGRPLAGGLLARAGHPRSWQGRREGRYKGPDPVLTTDRRLGPKAIYQSLHDPDTALMAGKRGKEAGTGGGVGWGRADREKGKKN